MTISDAKYSLFKYKVQKRLPIRSTTLSKGILVLSSVKLTSAHDRISKELERTLLKCCSVEVKFVCK